MAHRPLDESDGGIPAGIGTLNEKPLHAALRRWAAEEGDRFEVPVQGFVVDILRGPTVIEIQTRGASRLRHKLTRLLTAHPVRLVLPVAVKTTVVEIDEAGSSSHEKTSRRHGDLLDVFRDLVGLRDVLMDPNFSIDVVLLHEKEIRHARPSRGRRSYVVCERHVLRVLDCISLRDAADYQTLVPANLKDPFTTAELADALHRPRWMAQKVAYVLRGVGALHPVGKRGRAVLYRRARPEVPEDGGKHPHSSTLRA